MTINAINGVINTQLGARRKKMPYYSIFHGDIMDKVDPKTWSKILSTFEKLIKYKNNYINATEEHLYNICEKYEENNYYAQVD